MDRKKLIRPIAHLPVIVVCVLALSSCVYNSTAMKEGAQDHYLRGQQYYEQGKYTKANVEFKTAKNLLERDMRVNEKLNVAAPEARHEVASPKTNRDTLALRGKKISRPLYIIGAEDILYISVWQNDDLNQEVLVRPDGRISFPLIDEVEAEGLTIPQVDNQITEKLKEYIKYPQVSISIRRLGGKKVIVLGEVRYPGVYQVTGTESVLEAIAMAQGLTYDSLASSTVVIKGTFTDNPRVIRASLNMAVRGVMSQNILLESGDIVFVPKKPISDLNWLATELAGIMSPITGQWTVIKPLTYMNNAND